MRWDPGGLDWTLAVVFLPLAGALLCFLVPRRAAPVGLGAAVLTAAATFGLTLAVLADGVQRTALGGWAAPLGIL
jgi:NADH:ubiquinone oxidoreductase subunit 4 (subunit M)